MVFIGKNANLALRFFLEMGILAALAYWGFRTGSGVLVKVGLGIGAPLLAAVAWGTFGAPKAAIPLNKPLHLLFEIVIFGLAVIALWEAGQPVIASVFGVVVVINRILIRPSPTLL
jgi:hypothetical protein